MVSSYTPNIKLEKPAAGDFSSSWAPVANTQYQLIDASIAGLVSVDVTGAIDVTLTNLDGASDQARAAILVIKGTPSAQLSLLVPNNQTKNYSVKSKVTNSQVVVVNNVAKTGAGCTIAPSEAFMMYTDGVNCQKLGVVPKNTAALWTGTSVAPPPGWRVAGALNGLFLRFGENSGYPAVNPTVSLVSAGGHDHTGFTAYTSLTTAQMPAHTHTYNNYNATQQVQSGTGDVVVDTGPSTGTTGSTGSGDGHRHAISSDGLHTHTATATPGSPAAYNLLLIIKYT